MAPPILLTVDDDPEVSRSLARDLRQRYGEDYRIRRAESGASALEVLQELKLRNDRVALLLADHRMPAMTGVEFLEETRRLFPKARRVLLTAYADTDAAIAAINQADVHYYLLKPWDPPEEKLYPVLDDLLEDWRMHDRMISDDGLRVVGHRWSAPSHNVYLNCWGGHPSMRQQVGQSTIRAFGVGSAYGAPPCTSTSWTCRKRGIRVVRPACRAGRRRARRQHGSDSRSNARFCSTTTGAMTFG